MYDRELVIEILRQIYQAARTISKLEKSQRHAGYYKPSLF